MQVAILGAGGIGLGYAALLSAQGHAVTLWSPSGATARALQSGAALEATGAVNGSFRPRARSNCADAIDGATVVIIAVPGFGHRRVIDELAPHLRAGQIVVIGAHLSLSALYLSKQLAERAVELPIATWATTVTTGRRSATLRVDVSGIRSRLDLACVPANRIDSALAACRELFGDRFEPRADILAIALSNLNPPAHMASSLLNFTRIERAEHWENYGCITEGVGRLIEALDRERLAVAAAFGVAARTIVEHYVLSFNVAAGSVHAMAQQVNRMRGGNPPGPKSVDTRYVLEDVPFGLVPIVALARIAGVPVPLHEAGVELFSAIYARDFRRDNDLLEPIGLERMTVAELHRVVRDGFAKR